METTAWSFPGSNTDLSSSGFSRSLVSCTTTRAGPAEVTYALYVPHLGTLDSVANDAINDLLRLRYSAQALTFFIHEKLTLEQKDRWPSDQHCSSHEGEEYL